MTTKAEKMLLAADESAPRFDPWTLRCLMTARGLTLKGLAELSGYGSAGDRDLGKICRYAQPVGPTTLARLAKALDVAENELLSAGPEWRANKVKYERWVAEGRQPLARWLKSR